MERGGERMGARDESKDTELQRFLRKARQEGGKRKILGRRDSTKQRNAWSF